MGAKNSEASGRNQSHRGLTTAVKQSMRVLRSGLSLLNHRVVDQLELRNIDLDCLDILNMTGPLSPGELARRTNLHPATVTGILDRLEKGGWIVRERDPNDRRAVVVRALKDRNPELMGLLSGMNSRMDDICAGYSEADLEVILDFLNRSADAGNEAATDLVEHARGKE